MLPNTQPATSSKVAFAPWPYFAPDEIEAAAAVLRSGKVNYWTGDEGRNFEAEFAHLCGCQYAVALANGTAALEAALRALGIGPGDEVITTSRTFVASASCAVAVGARPIIADVDPDSQNITANTIERVLTPRTRAIIAVHLAGWPCDMDAIMHFARAHGLKVIEDCAQAHGATYKGRSVGSIGDIAAWSFCQDKIITTAGEGGMITTNSEPLWASIWAYKDHGKSYDAVYRREHAPGYRWLHESFGTNWRMTEVQSAIGRIALRKLPAWVNTRRKYAGILSQRFAEIPGLRVTIPPPDIEHAYYKYYAFVKPEMLRPDWTRDRIVESITTRGVPCFTGSCSEIYLEKAFPQDWRPVDRLPIARQLGDTSLMFLVHPTLDEQAISATADVVEHVMNNAVHR
jgi:dTDP-4-amino-4,6-dideoxygalactose transaminase